jgi:hypothetical protein
VDSETARATALVAAAAAVPRGTGHVALTSYAESLIPWLTQLPAVRLEATLSLDGVLIATSSTGGHMASTAIIGTNTKFDVTVLPKDASDNTTDDTIAFATDDTAGAILTPSVSADGRTWTGTLKGVTGTVNVTATDTTTSGITPYTAQLIVTTGPTTHLVGSVAVT